MQTRCDLASYLDIERSGVNAKSLLSHFFRQWQECGYDPVWFWIYDFHLWGRRQHRYNGLRCHDGPATIHWRRVGRHTMDSTYSSGVVATLIFAPGNWAKKFSENAFEASGTASQTTKCESEASANLLENRLKAISEPIRPTPMKLILFGRWVKRFTRTCKQRDVDLILLWGRGWAWASKAERRTGASKLSSGTGLHTPLAALKHTQIGNVHERQEPT